MHHSKLGRPTSAVGHSLQVRPRLLSTNVRFASIPTVNSGLWDLSRWAISGLKEVGANAGLSPVRKRFHQFADGLDEHLRNGAERAILQGGDADRLSNIGQFNGECFKSGMFARQEEREADDHREETLRREPARFAE